MKRKSTILRMLALLALLLPWSLQAQNAKVSEYDGSANTAHYSSIVSTGTAQTLSGDYVDVQMPFSMYFGETQVPQGSTLRIWNNGSVTFDGITTLADARIAPLYLAAGYTTTKVYTSSSAQGLTVEWRKVVSGSNSYSFQLKLYPGGDIEFCYGPMTINSSISVLVGMMSSSEDIYRVAGANGGSAWDTIYRYTTGTTTRTLSSTYAPAYDVASGNGMVYSFTQPACVKPSELTATALAWNSIKLDWVVSSPGNGFEIKYSTNSDFDPNTEGTSKTVTSGTDVTYTLTGSGLQGSTTYYFYIRKVCSGTPSGWSPKASATTLQGCFSANMPSVTSDGVVSWTSPDDMVTSYDVKYGLAGFNPETEGTAINNISGLTTTLPVASLASATAYDIYLRTHCNASNLTTDWVGPITFNTPCGSIAVSANNFYTQNFEGTTIPLCWSEDVVTGSDHWTFNNGQAHFSYTPGASSRLLTPVFNLDPTGAYQVEFYHAEPDYSGGADSLWLCYRTSATGEWIRLAQYGNHSSTLEHAIVLLPNPTTTYQLAFVSSSEDYLGMAIANVVVRTQPTCPTPTSLAEVSHTGTSVTVSWTETGSATAWQIAYGQFTTENDYVIVSANTNPFTITGLTAEQTYYVAVRSYCASDDQSEWSEFATCNPTNSATLTVNDGTATNGYVPIYGFYCDANTASQFIIPASELTAMQWGTISKLTFYAQQTSVSWGNARFEVYMSEVSGTAVSSLTNTSTMNQVMNTGVLSISDGRMEVTLDNPYLYTGGNLLIAFYQPTTGSYVTSTWYGVSATGASMGGYGSSINQQNFLPKTTFNYIAGEPVTCFKPNGLAVSNVTTTSADLTWNEMGASTQWEVKYGPTGFNISEGEGISMIVNTTPSLTLDYLMSNTQYDAYVRAICANEGPTEWTSAVSFTTSRYPCVSYGNPGPQETVTIGNGTTDLSYLPAYSLYDYSYTQQIYTADEIGGAGIINSIAFNISAVKSRQVDIYLVETDKTSFASTSDWVAVTDANKVFTGTIGNATGWETLTLTTPFNYTGTGNLVVVVNNINGAWSSGLKAKGGSGYTNMSLYKYRDGTIFDPSNLPAGTRYSSRNNLQVGIQYASCVTGKCNPPQVAITLSDAEYAATLAFTNMNEDITNPTYGIIWGPQGFNPATSGTTVSPISANTYTLSNLTQTTTYDVYVYAISAAGNSDTVRCGFTTPFIPNCKTPNTIAASNVTYNNATITWNQPGDQPMFWTVRYAAADFNPATAAATDYTELTIQGTAGASAQLTGLVAGTTYYVYAKATCSTSPIDESPWSSMSNANPAFTFTTPACVTPTAVAATDVTNSTAMISWTEAGVATAWTVKYGPMGFDPDNEGTAVACTADSVELTGLDPYVNYDVYVKSNCTATDESGWSSPATFRTVCPDGGSATIGDGTSTTTGVPVANYGSTYCQQIFTADELREAGVASNIAGLAFNWSAIDATYDKYFSIWLANTDQSEFATTSDFVPFNELTQVYGPVFIEHGTGAGEQEYVFNAPFQWDGTSNIVVVTLMNAGASDNNASRRAYTHSTGSVYRSMYQRKDGSQYSEEELQTIMGSSRSLYRANITFIAPCNTNVTCFAPASVTATVAENNNVTVNWAARTDLRPIVNNFEMKYGLAGFNPANQGTLVPDLNNVFNYIITADLNNDADYDVYVRTVCGNGDYSNWTKATFHTYPSCWAPTGLTVTGTTSNSATLSWTENTPTAATRWEVVYGLEGFDPDRVTPLETTNNTAFEVTGLKHTSKYEFYVRAKCSATDVSPWSAVATGTTQCGVWQYEDMPLVENFDGYTGNTSGTVANHRMPNCWNYLNTGTNSTYLGLPSIYSTTSYAHSTPNTLRFYSYNASTDGDQYAILPEFGFALDTLEVSFYARFYNTASSIVVGVISDPTDVSTFVPVETINAPSTGYSTQTLHEVSFSEYTGSARYVAFMVPKTTSSNAYRGVYMDDLTVKLREKVNVLANNGGTMNICNEFVMPDTTNGGYSNNINATYVIRPSEAGKVVHLTGSYDLENGYDFLKVYRGAVNANNLVATYTGNGSIDYMTNSNLWADSGYVTLVFTTDADNAFQNTGFKLLASCECPMPAAETVAEVIEANGTYTWRNGNTYTNNVAHTYTSYDPETLGIAEPDLLQTAAYTYVNVAGCDSVNYSLDLTVHPTYNLTYSATICERDVFAFYGNNYTTTGTYTVNLTSQFNADSTGVLVLQVNPAPSAAIRNNGREVTEIADYCDGANLTLVAISDDNLATFAWEDQSTNATRVVNPHESNTYTVIATNPTTGCTSVPATVTVTTTPVPALTITGNDEICFGQNATLTLTDANNVPATYRWSNGATGTSITVTPTTTTTYTVTATTSNASACTDQAEFTVTVNPLPVVTATASVAEICRDSAVTLTATEVEGYTYSWNTGATTAVATTNATATGAYTVTVTDQNGCVNEFNTATVTVNPSYELNTEMSVCYVNNPYTWENMTITADGVYDQMLTTRDGHACDSLVHLTFAFQQMGVENSNITRCQGTTYTFNGNTYVANADTSLYYIDQSGECPVRYNLFVTVNPVKASSFEYVACDSYTWPVSGVTYTESGAYPYTLATTKGCDSVVTMNLTVNYQNTGVETVTACDNYVWDLNGVNYTASTNEPTFTLQNQWGCDSVVTLDLTINVRTYHTEDHCVSDQLTFTWIDGQTYRNPVEVTDGVEWITGTNEAGCNEIAQLHLMMNVTRDTLAWTDVTACDEYVINNAVVIDQENCQGVVTPLYLRENGDYVVRTRAADGHDQINRIHLTVNPSTYHTTVANECLPYTWVILDENNQPFEVATITADMVNGAAVYNTSVDLAEAGYTTSTCSSIEVLRLTPKYPTVVVDTVVTICTNGIWTAENSTVFSGADYATGIYTWDNSTLNADGCPMTKQVDLTVNPAYTNATAELTFCESDFNFNEVSGQYELAVSDNVEGHNNADVILTIPGALNEVVYTNDVVASWQTALGCDSIVTISYTVNPTLYRTVDVADACHDYTWHVTGRRFGEPGTYTDTAETIDPATGCKVVNALNLTVLGTSEGTETRDVCTSYIGPDGVTYYNNHTFDVPYEGQLPIVNGCDSITHVTYNVRQNALIENNVVTNQPYTWVNGETYTQNVSNVYYQLPADNNGCFDVKVLTLTMVDDIVLCDDQLPYTATYGETSFTILEGASSDVWSNNDAIGNDTIIAYTIKKVTTKTLDETACNSYTWTNGDGQTYTTSGTHEYTTTNAAGCDSIVTLNLTVNYSNTGVTTVVACDSYVWHLNGVTYTASTEEPTYTLQNQVGCDSVVTLHLTINVNNGAEVSVSNGCDSYTWERNGVTYNASGNYTHSFQDANGCMGDSVLHLTINPSYETFDTLVVNETGSYTYLGVMYSSDAGAVDTTITHTFQSINGCDSLNHFTLIIPVMNDIVEIPADGCGTYTWTVANGGTGHTYQWIPMSERQQHSMALYKDITANKYVYSYPTDTTFTNGVMTQVRVLHLNLLESTTSTETVNVPVSLGSYTIDGDPDDVTVTFTYAERGTTITTDPIGVGSVAYCNDYRTFTINVLDNYDTTEVYACADATTYEWNSQTYTIGTPGHTFYFSQKENEGTMDELVHVLKVNQRAVNAQTVNETACDTYTWTDGNGQTYTSSVSDVVFHYTDANNCDATKTLNLTVNYNTNTVVTKDECDTYTWSAADNGNGNTYTESGEYTYNYNAATNGCPSVNTLNLTIRNNTNQTFTKAECVTYTWSAADGGDGRVLTTSGTQTYEYTATNGCPSVNTLNLTINQPTNAATTMVACDSAEWHETMYFTTDTFYYNYNTTAGCASVDTLFLTINNGTHNSETLTQCDSYEWNGTTYTASSPAEGYTFGYTNTANCPSVDTLHLTINVNNTGITLDTVACDEFVWELNNNRLYNTSGTYTCRTTDINGCGTTNTLQLTINHTSSQDSVLYISDGSYRYYGQTTTELFGEGVYNRSEHYTNVAGCDSTLNITFNVGTALLGVDNVVNCNSYTWRNGETYVWISDEERAANLNSEQDAPLYKTIAGTYVYYNPTYTVERENAYDSVYMLALTLTQSASNTFEATMNISEGTYTFHNYTFNFDTLASQRQNFVNTDKEFEVSLPAVQHCDSVISLTLHLVNNYQEVTAENADICVTQTEFAWRGQTISTATTDYDNAHTYYVYDAPNANGIIEYIKVLQHPFAYASERRTACDSYTWNGNTYTESTSNATAYFPAGTVINAGQDDEYTLVCDSTVTLILTINHNTSTEYNVEQCVTYTWTAAEGGNGETYTENGDYEYSYYTAQGCPSVNTLHLTINQPTSTEYTVDECDTYTWTAENGGDDRVLTATGDYTYNYNSIVGNCPSINTLHLTIRNNTNQAFTKTACDSYVWTAADGGDDLTYTTSGTYTYDYTAANGCPSTNTLTLTVNNNSGHTEDVVACDSALWHGIWYYADNNTATYDYNDVNNCPSVDHLNLTINHATHNALTEVACNEYTWTDGDGQTYTTGGVKLYDYVNTDNCPSTDTLYLTIGNGAAYGRETVVNCGPYTWTVNDQTIGTYTESVQTSTTVVNPATGCDSTIFLYLTINPQNVTEASICDDGEYVWTVNNTTYTEAGTYDVSETDNDGNCISNERLILTVNPTEETNLTDQICLGNGYTANGFNIDASELPTAGVYNFTDHRTTALDCEHTFNLTLTVGDVINNTLTEVAACDSYTWNGNVYTESGNYESEPYANNEGCTTIDILPLTINVNAGSAESAVVCDSYMWRSEQRTATGDYYFDFQDGNGCWGVDTLHLTVNSSVVNNIPITACDSYTWTEGDGQTYTASGVYTYNYTTTDNCNGTDNLILTVNHNSNTGYAETACDSYTWNGTEYTTSGDYTFAYNTNEGCPSVDTLHLTVNNSTTSEETAENCNFYNWHGETYTESGDYDFVSTNAAGCQHTTTLHLTVNKPVVVTIDTTNCGVFEWNGVNYDNSDVITHNFTAANGCDSTEVINLTVLAPSITNSYVTVCDSYEWEGTAYTTSGAYTNIYSGAAANGCDSMSVVLLTVNYSTNHGEAVTACDNYEWNNVTYTVGGTYTNEYVSTTGCPSVDTLYLTLNNSTAGSETAEACNYYIWNNQAYNQTGVYTYTTTAANGCDSVVTLNLTINMPQTTAISESACVSYTWNNVTYNASGVYTQNFTSAAGCDSTVTLTLTITPALTGTDNATACGSYTWEGTTYTQSGNYTHTYTAVNGCDSVVTMTLTINQPKSTTFSTSACDSYTWEGNTYTQSGTHTHTYTAANNCDSVVTMVLTIKNSTTGIATATACDSYTWMDGQTYTASTNTPTMTLTNAAGCDSVVTLHLTVNNSANTTDNQATCSSYTWNGTTYTQSGIYTHTYTAVNNCDSTVTLILTVTPAINVTTNVTACDSYTWEGATYTTSGTHSHTYNATSGCDSTVTLVLTIKNSTTGIATATACDSYTWMNGQTYTASTNTPTMTLTNAAGCDSVVTLHLTVNNSVNTTDNQTACNSYTWNGTTYTTSGTYTHTYTAANSCDSVVTLNLTITPAINVVTNVTACDSYTWNGEIYTTSGSHTYTYTATNGCDSVVTMNLVINESVSAIYEVSACDGFIWIDNVNYTESTNTPTITLTGANGCDSTVTLHLTINHSVEIFDTIDILSTQLPYNYHGNTVTAAGDYEYNGTTVNGCDSTVYLHVNVETVGIEVVNTLDEVKVYPNPTRGKVNVSVDDVIKVEVYDLVGRKVATFDNVNRFDISDLAEGTYTLRITLSEGVTTRRIVKK